MLQDNKAVNVSRWFNYYSFDVMGALAFGKSFNMLSTGSNHWAIELLNKSQKYFGSVAHDPWVLILLRTVPGLSASYQKFVSFCEQQIDQRSEMELEKPDISSWILQAPSMSKSSATNRLWLTGDARLIIVAGSDTTAASLTYLFYHLAKEPKHADQLRKEILTAQGSSGDFSSSKLAELPHLNGAINETLRLHPPVLSGVQRTTPRDGVQIGDVRLPGQVNVVVPYFALHRCKLPFLAVASCGKH